MKRAGALVGLVFALATHVEAAEIKVISTGGARAVMTSLVPEFERKSGHKVDIVFGTPGNMRDRLLQGEAADVAVAIAAILPDLEKAGKIAPGTRREFAASYVGVVVHAGAPKLDVSTPDGVKRAVLVAKTVALSDPKAGTQLGATFYRRRRSPWLRCRSSIARETHPRPWIGRGGSGGERRGGTRRHPHKRNIAGERRRTRG